MRGIYRINNYANRLQAWRDWNELADKARQVGLDETTIEQLQPPDNAGWRTIDKRIAKLRAAITERTAP